MPVRRFVLRLLAYADAFGAEEELIGDVIEELGRGRPRCWACQQVIGVFGLALTKRLRGRARLTPQTVAAACCVLLFAGVATGSVGSVVEAWLAFYYVAGTLSLFAHMASPTASPSASFAAAELPNLDS